MQGKEGPYNNVSFSMGVSRKYGDGTDWFLCSMSGKRAEALNRYFNKGDEIIVVGRLEKYKPAKDPEHERDVVRIEDWFFGQKKNRDGSGKDAPGIAPEPAPGIQQTWTEIGPDDDDVPF